MARIKDLEEQIKILSSENESLVKHAEEIELMALISEKFEKAESISEIYEILLEQISIIKTIPYCSVYLLENNIPVKEYDYSYLYEDNKIVESFSLTQTLAKKINTEPHLFVDNKMKDFNDVKIKFIDTQLVPDCFLFIPFDTFGRKGFFFFADNCDTHNLYDFVNILKQTARLTANRITNITLLEHINTQNENLEKLVEEKSTELYESEAKYRELIEHLPDAVLIHHNGIIEYANPYTVKLLEVESEMELLNKNIMDFILPEWRDEILQKIKKTLSGKGDTRSPLTEFMMITAKGNKIFVEASGSKFSQIGEGRIQVIVRDITKRKLHEQKMIKSEEKFRLAFETAPDAIVITRLDDGTYVETNRGFEKISGYSNEEIKGISSLKLNIWENPADRKTLVNALKKNGFVNNFKANFKIKDGSIMKGLMSARMIELNGIPHLLSTTRDITEQEEAKEIIETQNEFLNSVINSLSNPFVVIDPEDYTVILANPAASGGHNVIGEKCYNTYHKYLDNCRESEYCPLNQIKKTKKPYTVEHEHIDANGNIRAFEIHGHPVLDEKGELIQMIEYSIDVSKQKKALTALKESEQKFRMLFEKAAVGLTLLNIDGKIVNVNEAALSIFELTREQMVGKPGMSLFSQKELQRLPPQLNVIFEKGNVEIEREYVTPKGEKKYIELLGSRLSEKIIIVSINDLTDIKSASEKTKASEQKFRSLFEKSPIGLALGNDKGIITDVNEALMSIYELGKDDIIGKRNSSFFTKEEREKVPSQIKNILKKGSLKFEREYLTPKGKLKYLEFNASKITDKLVFISVNDFTENRLAAEKLKASEKKFKSLIEQSPVGILIMQKGQIIFANKVLAKTLGFEKTADLLGKKIIDFVHPDFREIAKSRMNLLLSNGKMANSLEEKFIQKDGKVIDVLILGQSIEFEGEPAIQSYIYDITEDKKLREENRTLKFGIECVKETAVVVTNTEGKITYANPGFTNIYGYTGKEILGKNVSIIKSFMMEGDFYNHFEKSIKQHQSYSGELFNKTKDGTLIRAEISLTPIFSPENKFMGYIEIHKDVTERRKAEAELVKAKEAAEQADKVKSEFLAQMSHEIRTPINAIVSFSGLLKDELEDIVSEDLKTSFSLIDRAGQRIIRTVDLILNLSEIHTGSYQCILKDIYLYNDVLASIIMNYKYLAQAKNLELEVKKNFTNQMIKADSYALEQIFKNLIDNAIKYTPEGKVIVEISDKEEHLSVKIEDTGIGISKEYLPKLFEPFSQEESGYTRSFEGNGIGLALVKEYCRLNNIAIYVESEKGKGTTFMLTFAG